jgi:DNA-binding LacI/PurR family transcriptional regulator
VLPGDFGGAAGRSQAIEAVTRWPDTDAVFALGDAAALGALAGLRSLGMDVPGDVAVAGYDDIPAAAHSGPALTTATHPVERIATAAAEAALRPGTALEETWFGSELVVRDSA